MELTNDRLRKYHLYKLALEWASKFELPARYDLELRLWLEYLSLDEGEKEGLDVESKLFNYGDLLETLNNVPQCETELSEELKEEAGKLLVKSLEARNFWLALKLEKMFGLKNADLELLKLCYSLAEGRIMPYQLTAEQRLILTGKTKRLQKFSGSYRRPFLSARLSGFSSGKGQHFIYLPI